MPITLARIPHQLPASLEEAALAYAAAGIAVFPCAPSGKTPLTHTGYREASTSPSRIRAWWRWQPEANIGIPTGLTVDVLDIDVHPQGTGYPSLQRLTEGGFVRGWSQLVSTPSEGLHLYFPSDPDRPLRSWSRHTAHIDFRGLGGYIIAPPSRISTSGAVRQYTVEELGRAPRPVDAERIKQLLTPPKRPYLPRAEPPALMTDLSNHGATRWFATQQEGNRHNGLFWAACVLTESGAAAADIFATLDPIARALGLPDAEIQRTIQDAYDRAASTAPPQIIEPAPAYDRRALR